MAVVKSKVIEEAYRLSELRLHNQLQLALAADSRAMSFAGPVIVSAVILIGLSNGEWLSISGATLLILSAMFAVISSRPVTFYAPGAKFSDLDANKTYEAEIKDIGGFYDKHIDANRLVMRKNSKWLLWSFITAIFGLLVSVLGQVIPCY